MANITNISYCDSTQSFWVGCTAKSPGCLNCWAEQLDKRHLFGPESHWGPGVPRYKCKGAVKSLLAMNRRPWVCPNGNKPMPGAPDGHGPYCADVIKHPSPCCECGAMLHRRKVFINQQADWLDPEVPIEWLAEMLDTIRQCPDITLMMLTKRPELWRERLTEAAPGPSGDYLGWRMDWLNGRAPANVMVGTTVEDQKRADERIPHLLKIPAAFRFLSVEPQLEDINLGSYINNGVASIDGHTLAENFGIDLVICGGESGKNARPFNIAWARSLRDQCKAAGVPYYMKQLGSNLTLEGQIECAKYGPMRSRSGADPKEWPEDLRIQDPFNIERV